MSKNWGQGCLGWKNWGQRKEQEDETASGTRRLEMHLVGVGGWGRGCLRAASRGGTKVIFAKWLQSVQRMVSFGSFCGQWGKHLPHWMADNSDQAKLLIWIAFWRNLFHQRNEPTEGKIRLCENRSCDKGRKRGLGIHLEVGRPSLFFCLSV